MDPYQRSEAEEYLSIITDVDPDKIEACEDYELEAWLAELGYEWKPDRGIFGAWVPIANPPPVFAPVAVHVECSDFGPLFEA